MATWRIYYGDGTTVEGDTRAQFVAAPARDVQVVATIDFYPLSSVYNVGRLTQHGLDYYAWPAGATLPRPMDAVGVLDALVQDGVATVASKLGDFSLLQLATAGVKFGRWLDKVAFLRILDRATTDPGFPAKSAWRAGDEFSSRRLSILLV